MKPLFLGNLKIETPIALGPMAGVTDLPFRMLAREQGCGMFYTELISAKALYYNNRNTDALMATSEGEHPVGLQLFGSDPDIIAEQALRFEDRFDFIDLNMGCPVPKVVKNGEGSALMLQPELTEKILSKLVKTVHKPVTVKMRKGFRRGEEQAAEIAKIAESCGVSLVAVHARTREEYYSGRADWEIIRKVKEAVSIPVIGNGDIVDGTTAKAMTDQTGCDGIMVARAAEGNPWIFREIRAYLDGTSVPPRPSYEEIKEMILRHAELLISFKGEYIGTMEMRKHAAWYLSGQPNAAVMRRAISEIHSFDELKQILDTTGIQVPGKSAASETD